LEEIDMNPFELPWWGWALLMAGALIVGATAAEIAIRAAEAQASAGAAEW
jgi:hypothetical protein